MSDPASISESLGCAHLLLSKLTSGNVDQPCFTIAFEMIGKLHRHNPDVRPLDKLLELPVLNNTCQRDFLVIIHTKVNLPQRRK